MVGARPLTPNEVDRVLLEGFSGMFKIRNQTLFIVGITTGFRISELLSLKVSDVLLSTGEMKNKVEVKRRNIKGKTRSRSILLNDRAKEYLQKLIFVYGLKGDDYLFKSRESDLPIDPSQAWRILDKAFSIMEVFETKGTHCMRKTFAREVYIRTQKNLLLTSHALGHKYVSTTQAYLPVETDLLDQALSGAFTPAGT